MVRLREEYSELTLNLKEILAGKEIDEKDVADIEFLVKASELFSENVISATTPLLIKLTSELARYTQLDSDITQTLITDPHSFDELAERVLSEYDGFDVDEARRALRQSVATYIKGLQAIFLNFYPRLKIHSQYINYLKKQNAELKEKLENKNQHIKKLKNRIVRRSDG